MPELPEGIGHYITTTWGLKQFGSGPFHVTTILVDLTGDEGKSKTWHDTSGLPKRIDADSPTLYRGTNGAQGPLLAPELQKTADNPNPIPITSLKIVAVHHAVRAIVLDLGSMWLRIAYLTHTSIQVYTLERWQAVIRVPWQERGFSIGLALECEEGFVLAFCSIDKLFQPTWATTRAGLGIDPPYALTEYRRFLQGIANWIQARMGYDRKGFAISALRASDAREAWVGIGSYSVNEIFFLAGIPGCIRERELFDCPSRTARLCEAVYALAKRAEETFPTLLRSAWDAGMLAPTAEQRREYPRTFLRIYGKELIRPPERLVSLAEDHNANAQELSRIAIHEDLPVVFRSEFEEAFPDPYEAGYNRCAMEDEGKDHLTHLIYGEQELHRIQVLFPNLPIPKRDDPITAVFQRRDLLGSSTYLRPHPQVFDDFQRRRFYNPFCYVTSMRGTIWSLVDIYPSNTLIDAWEEAASAKITQVNASQHSFVKKSTENGVAIGPLEYCGNGRVFKAGGQRKLKLAVRGFMNPELRETDVKRLVIRDWRKERDKREQDKARAKAKKENREVRSAELNAALRKPLTLQEKKRRDAKVEAALTKFRSAFGICPAPVLEALQEKDTNAATPAKKAWVRGSADRDLLQENLVGGDGGFSSVSSRRTRSSIKP